MQNRIDQLASGKPTTAPHAKTIHAAGEVAATASNQLAILTKKVEEGIARHPVISLSVGLAIGATLGWLLKRK